MDKFVSKVNNLNEVSCLFDLILEVLYVSFHVRLILEAPSELIFQKIKASNCSRVEESFQSLFLFFWGIIRGLGEMVKQTRFGIRFYWHQLQPWVPRKFATAAAHAVKVWHGFHVSLLPWSHVLLNVAYASCKCGNSRFPFESLLIRFDLTRLLSVKNFYVPTCSVTWHQIISLHWGCRAGCLEFRSLSVLFIGLKLSVRWIGGKDHTSYLRFRS